MRDPAVKLQLPVIVPAVAAAPVVRVVVVTLPPVVTVVVELAVVALPLSAAVIVPAPKLPLASRNTIVLPTFVDAAVIVAEFAWLVIVPALPVTLPVTLPTTAPVNPTELIFRKQYRQ